MDAVVIAVKRDGSGRGDARRLRREGMIPAIVYGSGDETIQISCEARKMKSFLKDEAFSSSVIVLDVQGQKIRALLRAVQKHPFRQEILHMDFQSIHEDTEISMSVPLHFINADTAPSIRLHHGIFTTIENEVSLHCLPKNLPEAIVVDVENLALGKSIHLSELTPPPGVRFEAIARGEDPALAIVSDPKSIADETEPKEVEIAPTEETPT